MVTPIPVFTGVPGVPGIPSNGRKTRLPKFWKDNLAERLSVEADLLKAVRKGNSYTTALIQPRRLHHMKRGKERVGKSSGECVQEGFPA